MFDSKEMCRI